jgi:KaiC/GvpD/RAD55 family RecA-like ATPase
MMYEFKIDDAERFAQEQGLKAKRIRNELVFQKCPYCGSASRDEEKFAINLQTGQFNCLRASCGAKGNMLTLARDFDFSLGRDADTYYRIGAQRHYRVFKKNDKPIEPNEAAIEYLKGRGIPLEVIRKYQITADNNGNIIFPFLDEDGQLQFIKYRNPDPKEGQNKEWCERDCKPILFGMFQCDSECKELIITEGQIDSLSVAAAGIKNAVSVPTGANGFTWVPHCWDWMNKFDKIIIFGDHEHNRITLFNEIAARWKYKVWHVKEEDYLDCKDANEILRKYGTEQIRKCVRGALQRAIPRVKDLSKVEYLNPYDISKLPTGINNLDNLLCGGLPFGQVVLLTGKAGEGKSTFASQLLLSAIQHNYKCFAYSGELPNYLFKSWIDYQAAGSKETYDSIEAWTYGDNKPRRIYPETLKKITEWYKERIWIYDNTITEDSDNSSLLTLIEQVINQYGVKVVLLDNLMTALDLEPSTGADKYDRQSLFMKKVTRLALQYEVLVILVAHKRKNDGSSNTNDNVSGSADIANLASIVLSYERNPDDGNSRLLKVTKNRLFGKTITDGFWMKYDDNSKRIYMNDQERDRVYGWNNPINEEPEEEKLPWD